MTAHAADWITHSGVAGIAALFLQGNSVISILLAVALGFVTHAILDLLINEFKGWPPTRYWLWYVTQVIAVTVLIVLSPPLAVWAIIGCLLPDIIDGVYGFLINKAAWMRGDLLFWFHRPRKASRTMSINTNIIVAALAALIYIVVLYIIRR